MLIIKRSVAIIAILFSPLSTASNLTSQLHNFFSAQLAGVSDEVRVSIRTAPNLLPPCEQPLLSMSNNSRLWGNVNVLARCGNDKRYLQVNVQATGNYVVAAMPIARGGKLEAGNVKLKRGRLDTLPPRTVLDINQLVCNFAFFSGLIDAQFWAGIAQLKSPELTAKIYLFSSGLSPRPFLAHPLTKNYPVVLSE